MTNEGIQVAMLLSAEDRAEAFESVVRAHERMVLRVAWRMLGSLEDAQDTAQTVLLKLHRHFDRIERSSIESWLYRTTMNACYDALRRRKPSEPLDFDVPSARHEGDALELKERRQMLFRALARLPEKERAAIVLREIEGLETSEVARILGSTDVTVRTQVSMGKARLKKILESMR